MNIKIFLFILFIIGIHASKEIAMNSVSQDEFIIDQASVEMIESNDKIEQKTLDHSKTVDLFMEDKIRLNVQKISTIANPDKKLTRAPAANFIAKLTTKYSINYNYDDLAHQSFQLEETRTRLQFFHLNVEISSPFLSPPLSDGPAIRFAIRQHAKKYYVDKESTKEFFFILPDLLTNRIESVLVTSQLSRYLKTDLGTDIFRFAYSPEATAINTHRINTLKLNLNTPFSDSPLTVHFDELFWVTMLDLEIGSGLRTFVLNKMVIMLPMKIEYVLIRNYCPKKALIINTNDVFPNIHAITDTLEIRSAFIYAINLELFVGKHIKLDTSHMYEINLHHDIQWPRTNLQTLTVYKSIFCSGFDFSRIKSVDHLTFNQCNFVPPDNQNPNQFFPWCRLPRLVNKLSIQYTGMLKWIVPATVDDQINEIEFQWGFPAPSVEAMDTSFEEVCAVIGERYIYLPQDVESVKTQSLRDCNDYLRSVYRNILKENKYKMNIYPPTLKSEINEWVKFNISTDFITGIQDQILLFLSSDNIQ